MADPKDKGLTALEAVDRFCTYWTWAGTLSDDPEERKQAFQKATSELSAMLRHKIPDQPPRTIKTVFNAMMTVPQNPDQSLVPLWATGYRVGADRNAHPELIAKDMWFFKRRGRIRVDIEANAAVDAVAGGGLVYVDLRIYDAEPAQAVSGDAQDAVAIVDAMKVCGDQLQLQQAAELSEPAAPKSSAVRPNRAGRKKGSGSWDSKDAPLLKEIQVLVETESLMGLWNAALSVADRAPGTGTPESRAKRLVQKYKEKPGLR